MSDKPARIAALKAEIAAAETAHRAAQQERLDKLLRLSREFVAEGLPTAADREFFMGLPNDPTARIVSSMNVDDTGQSEAVKRAIARGRRNHPAQVILYEAGVTITDVAAELKETRQRVSAWMSDDPKAVRAIPRRVAEHLKRKYKIPLSAWSRIAD